MAVQTTIPEIAPRFCSMATALTGLEVFPPLTLDHIAPAPLNIATALRAEAMGGVSHDFAGVDFICR